MVGYLGGLGQRGGIHQLLQSSKSQLMKRRDCHLGSDLGSDWARGGTLELASTVPLPTPIVRQDLHHDMSHSSTRLPKRFVATTRLLKHRNLRLIGLIPRMSPLPTARPHKGPGSNSLQWLVVTAGSIAPQEIQRGGRVPVSWT